MRLKELPRKRGAEQRYELTRKVRRRGTLRELKALSARLDLALLGQKDEFRPSRSPTVRGMLGRFLRYCRDKRILAKQTVKKYERVLTRFADDFAAAGLDPAHKSIVGDVHLDKITYEALEDWQCLRMLESRPGTVNNEVKMLKRFARQAIKWGLWTVDESGVPWLSIDNLRECPRQPAVVPYPELEKVLLSLPYHIQLVLWVMAIVCDRPGALCGLRFRDILAPDLENKRPGTVNLLKRKGGDPRPLPFASGSPLEMLLSAAAEQFAAASGRKPCGDDFVFVSAPRGRHGQPWTVQGLDNAIRHHLQRARLPKRLKEFTPYTIRHSLLTWAAQDGKSTYERKIMAGHRREMTCLVYTHTSGEATRKILEGMGGRMLPGIERVFRQNRQKWGPTAISGADHFGAQPLYATSS